jgi:hypothetical protein
MIVAKQLDLPDGPTGTEVGSPQQTPRTQLTRELEKYNRPVVAVQAAALSLTTVKKDPAQTPPHTPERPNILNKRPHHFRPQYRYEPMQGACSPLNLSMKELNADRLDLLSVVEESIIY